MQGTLNRQKIDAAAQKSEAWKWRREWSYFHVQYADIYDAEMWTKIGRHEEIWE